MDETAPQSGGNNTKLIMIAIVALLALGGIGYFLLSGSPASEAPTNTTTPNSNQENSTEETTLPSEAEEASGEVKEFTVTNQGFAFNPKEIRVSQGDTVRITFTSAGGTHDWVVDEFDARTQVLGAGESETIEFTANQTGTFEFYCSVGNHRQMGMVGNLVVE